MYGMWVSTLIMAAILLLWTGYKWLQTRRQQRLESPYGTSQSGTSRYLMLALICLIMFGSNVAYDSPSTLFHPLKEWLGSSATDFQYKFNLLYSIYAVPNVILPLYAGTMVDRFGFPKSLMALLFIVSGGVFVYCLGIQSRLFAWMFLGRLLLGVGTESLLIVQSGLATRYFMTANLAFALSMTISTTRFNTVLNYNFTPVLGESFGVVGASWVSFICTIVSLISGYAIVRLDPTVEKPEPVEFHKALPKKKMTSDLTSPTSPRGIGNSTGYSPSPRLQSSNMKSSIPPSQRSFTRNHSEDVVLHILTKSTNSDSVISRLNSSSRLNSAVPASESISPFNSNISREPPIKSQSIIQRFVNMAIPRQIKEFSSPFWFLTGTLIAYSLATLAFLPLATAFLQAKHFPNDPVQASSLVSIPDSLSFVLMPIIGYISDRIQHRTSLALPASSNHSPLDIKCRAAIKKTRQLFVSGLAITLAHLFFLYTEWAPEWNLIILGLGYSGFGSILYGLMAEIVGMDYTFWVLNQPSPPPSPRPSSEVPISEPISSDNSEFMNNNFNNTGTTGDTVGSDLSKTVDSWVVSAYGIAACLVNAAFSLAPIFVAWLIAARSGNDGPGHDETFDKDSYSGMEVFFSLVGLTGVWCSYMTEQSLKRRFLGT